MILQQREIPTGIEHQLQQYPQMLQKVFLARGVLNPAQVDLQLKHVLPPKDLPDIEVAAQRLVQAVRDDQHILIVGDFDADGATSVALCMRVLREFGAKHVNFVVPNRFEFGYGLSVEIVEHILPQQPDLIITVDNGVASVDGVDRARQAGVDVIVTDHHLPPDELPKAVAVVNPNLLDSQFPSKVLAGVGVAYYLLGVTRRVLNEQGWFDSPNRTSPNMAQFLDLVALGTVADVVPLDMNNRILVEQGVQRMRHGVCNAGIKALAEIAKRPLAKMTAQDLGFALGPRLNAAGRLDDMSIGIKCLLTDDLKEARQLASALNQLNIARRELEQDMVSDAQLMLAHESVDANLKGLVVYHASFHQGVVGIVAGRVRERFHRPTIVFADASDAAPDELKGSARSIDGVHIRDVLDSIATSHPGLLIKFGGHAMAAGLSIKRVHLERFKHIFAKAVDQSTAPEAFDATLLTDGTLSENELSIENAQLLSDAGPWGNGFAEPVFQGEFEVVSQRVVGDIHLKLVLKSGRRVVDAIAFRQAPMEAGVTQVLMAYKLGINDFGDWPTVQLVVEYLQAIN